MKSALVWPHYPWLYPHIHPGIKLVLTNQKVCYIFTWHVHLWAFFPLPAPHPMKSSQAWPHHLWPHPQNRPGMVPTLTFLSHVSVPRFFGSSARVPVGWRGAGAACRLQGQCPPPVVCPVTGTGQAGRRPFLGALEGEITWKSEFFTGWWSWCNFVIYMQHMYITRNH